MSPQFNKRIPCVGVHTYTYHIFQEFINDTSFYAYLKKKKMAFSINNVVLITQDFYRNCKL